MKLRYYQDEAIDAVPAYYMAGNVGNPLIALPTGTGKSLVIAGALKRYYETWQNQRFIVLTHVKELVEQNANKLFNLWPSAPAGIYSAGLKSRDTALPIIFGGIASVAKNIEAFGRRDLAFVDEAHLLSPNVNTMYQKVFAMLRELNPNLKVVGLTATPYRLGQGLLTDGGLFTDVIYDLTGIEGFNRLLAEGYLAPVRPKRTGVELDVSGVGLNNGEFAAGALEAAVDTDELTYAAVRETVEQGQNRKAWLVFASGIHHAEHVAEMLRKFGVAAAAVHSRMSSAERDEAIADFKTGKLRALVNKDVLTTGFDHPPVDLISMLRPTMSPGLWVQMLGRGTRPFEGKDDCLVLDFAGNTRRLGPINDPVLPKAKGKGGGGRVPIKLCQACGTYNHISAKFCEKCGEDLATEDSGIGLTPEASTAELIRTTLPIIETFPVDMVLYARHTKRTDDEDAPPTMKVTYVCGIRGFSEWHAFDNEGFGGKKARTWWRERSNYEPPRPGLHYPYDTATDAALSATEQLRRPARVRVNVNTQYPRIVGYEWA